MPGACAISMPVAGAGAVIVPGASSMTGAGSVPGASGMPGAGRNMRSDGKGGLPGAGNSPGAGSNPFVCCKSRVRNVPRTFSITSTCHASGAMHTPGAGGVTC